MRVYYNYKMSLSLPGHEQESIICAQNTGGAKHAFYQDFKNDIEYEEFKDYVDCEYHSVANVVATREEERSFCKLIQKRNLPFLERMMRVQVAGKMGVVAGNYKNDLLIIPDGQTKKVCCNPIFETVYYDAHGNVIKDFRKGAYVAAQ